MAGLCILETSEICRREVFIEGWWYWESACEGSEEIGVGHYGGLYKRGRHDTTEGSSSSITDEVKWEQSMIDETRLKLV